MSRAMNGYTGWVANTRAAIDGFVTDAQDKGAESDTAKFPDVVIEWIGKIPEVGEIAAEVMKAMNTLEEAFKNSPSEGLSLAELKFRETNGLDKLAAQSQNVNSDLPVYAAIRKRRDAEGANPAKDAHLLQSRHETALQVNSGLSALPDPHVLRQRLALAWVRQGEPANTGDREQAVEIFCDGEALVEGSEFGTRKIGPVTIPDPTRGKFGKFAGYRFDNWRAVLVGRATNQLGMVKALKHAYYDAPLMDLPLRVELTISVELPRHPLDSSSGPGERWRISWRREGATWAPQYEAKGDWMTDSLGSEQGSEIFRKAADAAKRLRVDDIQYFTSEPSRMPLQ
jgi:hypothetical protein